MKKWCEPLQSRLDLPIDFVSLLDVDEVRLFRPVVMHLQFRATDVPLLKSIIDSVLPVGWPDF